VAWNVQFQALLASRFLSDVALQVLARRASRKGSSLSFPSVSSPASLG
jgi:hypothetical protein